jgi:deaminated glutathione amidase
VAKRGVIKVATCQFAVGANVHRNGSQVIRQIGQAKRRGADVVHFPETALSGYAGTDYKDWDGFDWDGLIEETERIQQVAREKKVWVILGSAHRLSSQNKPHNSQYVIDPKGKIVDRYDKCFCTSGDLRHYSCGDHLVTFSVNGVKCGLLICYDVRFPELYRVYKKQNVQLMFQSFYNARKSGANIHTSIMPTTMRTRAATNYFWVSANNSSGYYQAWSSFLAQPDGEVVQALPRHRAGVMVNTVDTTKSFYDASKPYRDRAMRGVLRSGTPVKDTRSRDRKAL